MSSSHSQFATLLGENIKRFFFKHLIGDEIISIPKDLETSPKLDEKYALGDESWDFDN